MARNPSRPGDRLPIRAVLPGTQPITAPGGTLALVGAFQRLASGEVQPLPLAQTFDPPPYGPSAAWRPAEGFVRSPSGAGLPFQAWLPRGPVPAGRQADLFFRWPGDLPSNDVPFIHLRENNQIITQSDGPTQVFLPTSGVTPKDWRQLTLPSGLAPGTVLTLVVGMYDPTSGRRLDMLDATGNPVGNELRLGEITVAAPLVPDQACALIPATCDSQ